MNNKEQAIEKMLKVMCEEYGKECHECPCADCANEFIAEKLYNAGYRKVDVNSLIIDFDMPDEMLEEIKKDCLESIEYNIQEIRKETATDFLFEVKQLCKEQMDRFSHLCKSQKEAREETCRYQGVLAVYNELRKLAKKFGIEV